MGDQHTWQCFSKLYSMGHVQSDRLKLCKGICSILLQSAMKYDIFFPFHFFRPIDVRAVLPQFSPPSSPSHNNVKVKLTEDVDNTNSNDGGIDNPAASTSTLYIPTEDEIDKMETMGKYFGSSVFTKEKV